MNSRRTAPTPAFLLNLLLLLLLLEPVPIAAQLRPSRGQTVYVPAYSHIYHGDKELPFYLAVTLSIRNTDPQHSITIVSVDYYDSEGKLIRRHLEKPEKLGPLASMHSVVKESDKSGGSGANFLVRWRSDSPVTAPLMECVMIGTQTQQGISFTSRGEAIREE